MIWNKLCIDKYYYNPWNNNKNSKNINGYHNTDKKNQSPPDLENIIHNVFYKISNLFKHKSNIKTKKLKKNNRCFFLMLFVILIWISSGFYTLKEAERGVILRFGKLDHLVDPGLNWKPTFIDKVIVVNVESVRELAASGIMLTHDENVVKVEMNVQYRISEPSLYLFSVTNADNSLRQATDSALRGVIGKYTMDRILTEGRTLVRSDTQRVLEDTIQPYNMGISLLDVNFQAARPPEEVKAAFDDTIAARENEQQYIREAEAYANEVQPRANGKAQRILEEGRAYKTRTILEAQGEVQRFTKVLPEYRIAPEITRKRLYFDTMERILSKAHKILIDNNINKNLIVVPLEQLHYSSSRNNINNKHINSKTFDFLHKIPSSVELTNNNANFDKKVSNNRIIQRQMVNLQTRDNNLQKDNIRKEEK